MKIENYIEQYIKKEFNSLTLLGDGGKNKTGLRLGLFQCKCGKKKKILFHNVKRGQTKSCGCQNSLKREKSVMWGGYGEISGSRFCALKHDANKRKLKFNINIKYIWQLFLKQNRQCVYSGLTLTFASQNSLPNGTASLDRIDSSKGYIKGNIQWIHKTINFMKQRISHSDFLNWIKLIYEHSNSKF